MGGGAIIPNQNTSESSDELYYRIDSRYQEIKKRLLALSQQESQSISEESEYW